MGVYFHRNKGMLSLSSRIYYVHLLKNYKITKGQQLLSLIVLHKEEEFESSLYTGSAKVLEKKHIHTMYVFVS